MSSPGPGDKLIASSLPRQALLAVVGRGSVKVSGRLQDFGQSVIDSGTTDLIIDMAQTKSLDSTFMGILATIATELRQQNQKMVLLNLSEKIDQCVRGIGIDYLVECHADPAMSVQYEDLLAVPGSEVTASPRTWDEQKVLVGEAHEALASLSEENRKRFQPVADMCRKAKSRSTD